MLLSTAHPSKKYKWNRNFDNVMIEAHFMEKQVRFVEVRDGNSRPIKEELARCLFPISVPIIDRPFLVKENKEFWMILNRHRSRFKVQWETFLKNKTKLKRTKFTQK
jgi:hypothetical protein